MLFCHEFSNNLCTVHAVRHGSLNRFMRKKTKDYTDNMCAYSIKFIKSRVFMLIFGSLFASCKHSHKCAFTLYLVFLQQCQVVCKKWQYTMQKKSFKCLQFSNRLCNNMYVDPESFKCNLGYHHFFKTTKLFTKNRKKTLFN